MHVTRMRWCSPCARAERMCRPGFTPLQVKPGELDFLLQQADAVEKEVSLSLTVWCVSICPHLFGALDKVSLMPHTAVS